MVPIIDAEGLTNRESFMAIREVCAQHLVPKLDDAPARSSCRCSPGVAINEQPGAEPDKHHTRRDGDREPRSLLRLTEMNLVDSDT